MNVQWDNEQEKDTVILPSVLQDILVNNQISVQFGAWQKSMKVRFSKEISVESIILPKHFTTPFTIPENLPFEARLDQGNLVIGPVIGFLLSNTKAELEKLLEDFDDYVHSYDEINGLVIAFSSDSINTKNKTIKGYYYDPDAKDLQDCWKEGVFPYPSALYRRTLIPSKLNAELHAVIGKDKIFNAKYYHKWTLYRKLKKHSLIKKYLPETYSLTNKSVVIKMLNKHASVYLKPITGTYGYGIIKIERTSSGYQVVERSGKVVPLITRRDVSRYISMNLKTKYYIAQQDVGNKQNFRNIDFRAVVQKNKYKKWECTALIARYGKKNKIYTNDPSDVTLCSSALQSMFHLYDEELQWKIQEINTICKEIGKTFDQYGHYADLGIDFTVDKDMNVWILEINHLFHDHNMAAYLDDEYKTYEKVLSTLLDYLKTLSGF